MRAVVVLVMAAGLTGCESVRDLAVKMLDDGYEVQEIGTAQAGTGPAAVFDGIDRDRERINVRLREVASGFAAPTDIQFPPGDSERMIVLEKGGKGHLLKRQPDGGFGAGQVFLDVDVLVASEQGLLGAAFHPRFAENGKLYLNYVAERADGAYTVIAEWTVAEPAAASWTAALSRVVLRARQPYANHNAGQLAFGPDGMLYIGLGDGGFRNDPHEHGQDRKTWLGAMLRVDVDRKDPGKEYAVPPDNPFVSDSAYQPEIWATGLRNPWRYSFDERGRLLVADVGQDLWEEIDLVSAGDNLGWNRREGQHCFPEGADCPAPKPGGLVDPIHEYNHEGAGTSVTGGYVATAADYGAIKGRYVFGDFTSGRLWALDLPAQASAAPDPAPVYALGRWGMLISTFGRDAAGHVYVADYSGGGIYRIEG